MRRLSYVRRAEDFLLDQSTLYRWLRWKLNTRQTQRQKLPPPCRGTLQSQSRAHRRVGAARGGRVIFINFSRAAPYRDAMTAVANRLSVPLVVYVGPRLDTVHPTVEGYRQLAAALLDELERSRLLTPNHGVRQADRRSAGRQRVGRGRSVRTPTPSVSSQKSCAYSASDRRSWQGRRRRNIGNIPRRRHAARDVEGRGIGTGFLRLARARLLCRSR
jgi:hypothetical protein